MGTARTFRMPESAASTLGVAFGALVLVALMGVGVVLAFGSGKTLPLRYVFEIVVVPPLLGAVLWGQWRISRSGRLVIDDAGVRMHSDLPAWLSPLFNGNWDLPWSEIERVTVMAPVGVIQFHRKGSMVRRAVRAFQWVAAETAASPAAKPRLLLSAR